GWTAARNGLCPRKRARRRLTRHPRLVRVPRCRQVFLLVRPLNRRNLPCHRHPAPAAQRPPGSKSNRLRVSLEKSLNGQVKSKNFQQRLETRVSWNWYEAAVFIFLAGLCLLSGCVSKSKAE